MDNTLSIIIIAVLMVLALFVIPQLLMRRAISQVLRIFRQQNAFGAKNARAIDELGLSPRTMMQSLGRGRDYKSKALDALIKAEIVQMTDDGKLYLLEEKVVASGFYKQ